MKTKIKNRFEKLKRTHNLRWKNILAAVLIIPLMIITIANAERVIPVVAFMHSETISYEDNSALLHITGYKILDCTYIPASQVGYARHEHGRWRRVDFVYVGVEEDYSRQRSIFQTDFGLWQWSKYDEIINGPVTEVMVIVQHACGKDQSVEVMPDGTVEMTGNLRFTKVGEFPTINADIEASEVIEALDITTVKEDE